MKSVSTQTQARFKFAFSATVIACWITLSGTANAGGNLAYIGAGAGLGMISSLIAVLCILGLALLAPILYPIRLFLRWRKQRANAEHRDEHRDSSPSDDSLQVHSA